MGVLLSYLGGPMSEVVTPPDLRFVYSPQLGGATGGPWLYTHPPLLPPVAGGGWQGPEHPPARICNDIRVPSWAAETIEGHPFSAG